MFRSQESSDSRAIFKRDSRAINSLRDDEVDSIIPSNARVSVSSLVRVVDVPLMVFTVVVFIGF